MERDNSPFKDAIYAMVRMAIVRIEYTSLLLFWLLAGARCHFRYSSVAYSARWADPRFIAKSFWQWLYFFFAEGSFTVKTLLYITDFVYTLWR
jgi:hypothetical protein